jgi:phosphoribosyl-ATP pyrophosphohydrolase
MEMLLLKQPNREDLLKILVEKLKEETKEVRKAYKFESDERVIAEVLDNIQIGIGILDYYSKKGYDIAEAMDKHNLKLLSRKWRYTGTLHINVIRGDCNG